MPFDILYIGVIVVCALLSLMASALTKSRFAAAQRVSMRSGISGRDVAQAILNAKDIHDVQVVEHQGFLSDHYNPVKKKLALSPDVYHGTTAAAAGVAAHEVGHAIQHAEGYAPLMMRSLLVPAANFGASLGPIIIFIAIILGGAAAGGMGEGLALIGVGLFAASTLFTLVTLPVEFDASARAKKLLPALGITYSQEEDRAVAQVLGAAAMTYVAAAVSSILMLLYWAYRAGLIGGRR